MFLQVLTNIYLLLIFLILTSCNSNSNSVVCELVIKNHRFEPDKIYVQSGRKVELRIQNLDDTVEEFESYDLKRERIIPAHGSIKIILSPLKVGSYKFFGEFHEETAQGLLIVEDIKN